MVWNGADGHVGVRCGMAMQSWTGSVRYVVVRQGLAVMDGFGLGLESYVVVRLGRPWRFLVS